MPTSARREVANSPQIFVKNGAFCRADVGIGPYGTHGKDMAVGDMDGQSRRPLQGAENVLIRDAYPVPFPHTLSQKGALR